MKKIIPLLIVGIIGTLILSLTVDSFKLKATPSAQEKKLFAHYESVLKKLEFKSTNNKIYSLKNMKSKIIVLNFWASWCRPCLEEFPSLVAFKKKFTDDKVMVLAINGDEEKHLLNIKKTKNKFGFNFPVIPDKEGKIMNDFMITSIPVSIIYYKGRVIEVSQGAKDFNSEEQIEKVKKYLKLK